MYIISLRIWIVPFKLARLLVTHDGGKLSQVGKLSLAERLQGRYGNLLAGVRRNVRVLGSSSLLVNKAFYNGIGVASMAMTGFFDRGTDKFDVSSRFLAMAEVDFWCSHVCHIQII